jgi:hypothetical protein
MRGARARRTRRASGNVGEVPTKPRSTWRDQVKFRCGFEVLDQGEDVGFGRVLSQIFLVCGFNPGV